MKTPTDVATVLRTAAHYLASGFCEREPKGERILWALRYAAEASAPCDPAWHWAAHCAAGENICHWEDSHGSGQEALELLERAACYTEGCFP